MANFIQKYSYEIHLNWQLNNHGYSWQVVIKYKTACLHRAKCKNNTKQNYKTFWLKSSILDIDTRLENLANITNSNLDLRELTFSLSIP